MMMRPVNSAPIVKGWCPGALRPMLSGDGLVVRIRPRGGRLSQDTARGIAALAAAHGNGVIDLSNRANVQLRGVAPERYEPLIAGLRELDLIDADAAGEGRRNILCAPFWRAGEGAETLAAALAEALARPDAPDLPGKFGYAIDTGPTPLLQESPADIRLERDAKGGLLLCADGVDLGRPVSVADAIPEMLSLARWFRDHGGAEAGRMRRLLAAGTCLPEGFARQRQQGAATPKPGPRDGGFLLGLAFGQIAADTLARLAEFGALRVTPWRMLLIEGLAAAPDLAGLITDPDDPLLRVIACIGAPGCAQGRGETRQLARDLAPLIPEGQHLHVSGCAKGCAHPRPAALSVTATASGYDLIRNGRADGPPIHEGLSPQALQDILKETR
ncbi:precorrin-3B synthase [Sulfitobacter aestuarii]|uniref:Precorrin-3B synthase n=1 Tax=Sulfitobacter aestuarii TaxID=2161676 RepID=A0ABW5U8X8_9RHOB